MAKRTFVGKILSDKMQGTVVVGIETVTPHKLYKKLIKKVSKLQADTNKMEVKTGDTVKIEETRPISKNKFFKVIERVEKAG